MRGKPEPRFIRPETIDVGDTIRVTFKKNDGIEMSLVGTVARREDHGAMRQMITAEGGIILAWSPGEARNVRVTLLDRAPHVAPALFDMNAEIGDIRQRISG